MPASAPQFEIRFRAHRDGAVTTLHQSRDVTAATVAFHTALEQLRAAAHEGDVLLVKYDPVRHILLRQAL